MTTLDDAREELNSKLDETISVIVGRKASDGVESTKLAMASNAAEAFRDLVRECVDNLHER